MKQTRNRLYIYEEVISDWLSICPIHVHFPGANKCIKVGEPVKGYIYEGVLSIEIYIKSTYIICDNIESMSKGSEK